MDQRPQGEDEPPSPSDGRRSQTPAVSVRTAVMYGTLAGLGTYCGAVVFLAIHVVSLDGATVAGVGVRAFVVGTFGDFFGTHYLVTDGVVLGGAGAGTIPVFVYHLVAPVTLCVSGRWCAATADPESGEAAFLNGATVALGYGLVVMGLLGVLVTVVEVPLLGLDPVRAVLFAGVVYPVVFGGLGGYSGQL